MKASTIKWHLARDNREKLARFCQNNAIRHDNQTNTFSDGVNDYFEHTYYFSNNGFIKAEMLMGGLTGHNISEHFQVVDYSLGMN
jgi:hypothetical protein